MSGCRPDCFYYTDSCFRKDCTMTTPAHKHVGDAGKPGQIVTPINTDLMDDMGKLDQVYADVKAMAEKHPFEIKLTRRGNPVPDIEPAKRVTWSSPAADHASARARTYIVAALQLGADLDTIIKDL